MTVLTAGVAQIADGSPQKTMMATTFLGHDSPGKKYRWEARAFPELKYPTDIIARVHKTTICGTDLHILGGNVPTATPGIALGHEGIIDIIECGTAVEKFKVGDRVLACCISACGECSFCLKKEYGNCTAEEGSWAVGHRIDGMQSQFVRVPHADNGCYPLPQHADGAPLTDEEESKFLMLADILPTSYEIGLVDGAMTDGKSVAVVGCGPVGLAGILCAAGVFKPSAVVAVDLDESRLEKAMAMGATHSIKMEKFNPGEFGSKEEERMFFEKLRAQLPDATGVDVVVEAVGLPSGWAVCQEIVKPGGNIAILGVHGSSVTLNLETMWHRNFKLSAGMVHGYSIPDLMDRVNSKNLKAEMLISHTWKLSEVEEAYDLFASRKDGALKMLLVNDLE